MVAASRLRGAVFSDTRFAKARSEGWVLAAAGPPHAAEADATPWDGEPPTQYGELLAREPPVRAAPLSTAATMLGHNSCPQCDDSKRLVDPRAVSVQLMSPVVRWGLAVRRHWTSAAPTWASQASEASATISALGCGWSRSTSRAARSGGMRRRSSARRCATCGSRAGSGRCARCNSAATRSVRPRLPLPPLLHDAATACRCHLRLCRLGC